MIADGPRSVEERIETEAVRKLVDRLIDWDCEVYKNYADKNRGVYQNIGEGAKWVLAKEERAVFLEDDNLPETTFFDYCKSMLEKYVDDSRVLWICGTNYLETFQPKNGASYMFTQHLLPCGWATWSNKFRASYDGQLEHLTDDSLRAIADTYQDKRLFWQDRDVVKKTERLLQQKSKMASWDRQMLFSLRLHSQMGVSPSRNQIRNIGVDAISTHGGTSMRRTMTSRFCEIPTMPLSFPLRHPPSVLPDPDYERLVGKVILYPWRTRILMKVTAFLKPLFGIDRYDSLALIIKRRRDNSG
ncbi:MAG: glycosyltransferase family 2 protein [Pseudomonadota bacterium]